MRRKGEQGAIMIEATWCVLLVMFVFLFMLSFGFLLYQRVVVHVVAEQVAEEVVQTYKLKSVGDSGSVGVSDAGAVGKYRFLLFKDTFEKANEKKAKSMMETRLPKTSLAKEEGDLRVDVKWVLDDVGRYHLEVTASQSYGFLLGDLLEVLGLKDVQRLESTVYVAGTDVLYYANTIHTYANLADLLSENDLIGAVQDVIGALHSLAGLTG